MLQIPEDQKLAECVGLWLAEGDKKTKAEVTFTNNSLDLVLFFRETINKIYAGKNKPRLYVYSPSSRQLFTKLYGFKTIRFYIDKRARRPYYIYRLADTYFLKDWKFFVLSTTNQYRYFEAVLRGIFAGEGNIDHNPQSNNHRSIRISCISENSYFEKLMNHLKLKYRYDKSRRQYEISGPSLNIADKINIASLHHEKEHKFNNMIFSVKEKHYSPNYLKNSLLNKLDKLHTSKELAKHFNRDLTRIQEVLSELKKENKVSHVKTKYKSLWGGKEVIEKFLMEEKFKLLKKLYKYKSITKLSKNINLGPKAIRRQLRKLEKEKLTEYKNNKWELTEKGKKSILGIDEAGR